MKKFQKIAVKLLPLVLLIAVIIPLLPAPSAQVSAASPPTGPADCKTTQYYVPPQTGFITSPAKCVNKIDDPRSASDCPSGYTYQPASNYGTPAKCIPSPTSCSSSQYYVAPTSTSQAKCVNKIDDPRSASDCPSGYTYQPASNYGTPAKCIATANACTSSQYFVPASNYGTPAKCVNKADDPRDAQDCPKGTYYVSASDSSTGKASCQPGSAPVQDAASTHSGNVTCDTGGFGINWILCPVFNSVAGMSGWMFSNIVQPFLRTSPISTNTSDPTYKIWSNFRIYGDIFLIIALLVVVFGQSLGGGMIDAYTAKKVLPRILAAAILINLSIYIVAALVDITNILGQGIGSLMTAPLKNAGAFNISPSGVQGGEILGLSATALTVGLGAGILGLVAGIAAIANFVAFIGLFILMPVFFGIMAAFITLILRKAIILGLILISPVAFCLYCLPNTEKYFKKWWDFLLQTLAVYPIVIIFFAVADILSVTIMQANGKSNLIAPIVAFMLQFLPLIFIPYSFRLAGGAIGRLHEVLTTTHKRGQEAIKGNVNDPWSLRNRTKRGVSNSMLMGREKLMASGNERQMKYPGSRIRGRYGALARIASVVAPNDVLRSRLNKESAEMSQGLVNTGEDWRYRAGFARRLRFDTGRKDSEGNAIFAEGWFGTGAQDVGGTWVEGTGTQFSDEQVRQSRAFIRSDPSHYQAGLTYEVGKAGDADELEMVLDMHDRNMQAMGVGEQQSAIWIGTAFAQQSIYKDLKHTRMSKNERGERIYRRSSRDHSREHAQTVNGWALGNMRERTVRALQADYENADAYLTLNDPTYKPNATDDDRAAAQATLARYDEENGTEQTRIRRLRDNDEAREVIDNVRSTADSLNARMLNNGTFALPEEGDGGTVLSGAQTGAPGKVHQAIQDLISVAGTPVPPRQPRS